jgi:hypothetical protein
LKTETERLNILILVFGLLLGAYARFLPTLMVGFPVTDGGLFYEMTKALQASHYSLPIFVEYNGMSIPFAYPPLGFYVTGLVSDIVKMPLLEAFRWIPAVGSVVFTIAFFPMASIILKSPLKGSLATVFFALLPRSISWYIMGGGVTRVMGELFLILTLFSAYKLFTAPSNKYLVMTILFGSGVVLSHPEAALHTISLCIVLWAFFGRSKEGMKNALLVALGVIVVTAPFFLTVISRHGLQPYLSAAQTGFQSPLAWVAILTGSFADEKFVTFISALALLGLVVTLVRREFLLAVFLFLPAFMEPRSAAAISIIPWAMLAAIGFVDIVVPGLYILGNKLFEVSDIEVNWHVYFGKSPAIKIALTALIFYAFAGAVLSDQVYPKVSLTAADRAAMKWVADNLPHQSRFIVLTGEPETFADAISEWFPVLSKSKSVATVQGYEWMPGLPFRQKLIQYYDLQACMNKTYKCVEQWEEKTNNQSDYFFISLDGLSKNKNALLTSFMESENYQLAHQEMDVYIFKHRP